MAEPEARRKLADRAAELYARGGKSYTEAVDEALGELNPANDPTVGEKLLYALLNVEERIVHPKRPSPRGTPARPDLTPGTTTTWEQSKEPDPLDVQGPDGPDRLRVAPADSQAK